MEQQREDDGTLVGRDGQGRMRSRLHLDAPYRSAAPSALALALDYLASEGRHYGIAEAALARATAAPEQRPGEAGIEYRLAATKQTMDIVTLTFAQTVRAVPVWRAGVVIQVQEPPLAVLSSSFTGHEELDPEPPSGDALERALRLKPDQVEEIFDLGRLRERLRNGRLLPPRINATRLWVYRFDADARVLDHDEPPPRRRGRLREPEPQAPGHHHPRLPLPPLPDDIRDGQAYFVVELLFTLTIEGWGSLNWSALIEPERLAVLYLRALVDDVAALVFPSDPVTLSGNTANGPAAGAAALDPLRQSRLLSGLAPPAAGTQALSGQYVAVQDFYAPSIAPPTRPSGSDFNYAARTNDFAAANAYYHCDALFRMVAGMGFSIAGYFDGTSFPVPVEHRGSSDFDGIFGGPTDNNGNQVNAQSLGNAGSNGQGALNFFLASTADTANPIGIAADWRVVLHEFGHTILWDHVDGPNFGFAHSAGDSLAAILNDPTGQAPDRFDTFPFTFQSLPASSRRRHDRAVAAGWGWGGSNDVGGYSSEQILSTTLFRLYRSLGGDSGGLAQRQLAARVVAYLILRAVGTLTPANDAASPLDFANALITADAGAWVSEGLAGGAYHKVIRWAFEKQGLYRASGAPSTSEGAAPAVDVYIDDGRAGQYGFLANHWSTTDIWNRTSSGAGGGVHQHPIVGVTNYAYVRIRNRGTATATNIVVRGFHCQPGVGLVYPNDWQAMTTNQLVTGNLAPGGTRVVGPFEWTPSQLDHECMFMSVSALGDASNIDGRITGAIPEWRLVPHDNNIAQRNVTPVAGGGGLRGLVASFEGRQFWVRNTLSATATIVIDTRLPAFLERRGWRLDVVSPGGSRFSLAANERRPVTLRLAGGAEFARGDVTVEDNAIDLTVEADGIVLGGMRYAVDPELEMLQRTPAEAGLPVPCMQEAARLLACLGLPDDGVRRVRLRKVTLDIEFDDGCC